MSERAKILGGIWKLKHHFITEQKYLLNYQGLKKAMNKIKIFLVDDHVIVRDSLKLALNSEENMFVIGEAGNSVDAIEQILYKNPDVVLMDINLPGKDGLSTAKEIKKIKIQ